MPIKAITDNSKTLNRFIRSVFLQAMKKMSPLNLYRTFRQPNYEAIVHIHRTRKAETHVSLPGHLFIEKDICLA